LVERFRVPGVACKVRVTFGHYAHYGEPLRTTLGHLLRAQRDGLESGDLLYHSMASYCARLTHFRMGEPMPRLREEIERDLLQVSRSRDALSNAMLTILRQVVAALTGRTAERTSLRGDGMNEAEWLERFDGKELEAIRSNLAIHKLLLALLYDDTAG